MLMIENIICKIHRTNSKILIIVQIPFHMLVLPDCRFLSSNYILLISTKNPFSSTSKCFKAEKASYLYRRKKIQSSRNFKILFKKLSRYFIQKAYSGSPSLTNEQTVGVIVVIRRRAHFLLRSQTVRTILVGRRYAALDCLRKLSAVPCEGVGAYFNGLCYYRLKRRCLLKIKDLLEFICY